MIKKIFCVLVCLLALFPLFADSGTLFVKAGPSYSIDCVSFDDAYSLMSCIGGKIVANVNLPVYLSADIQYAKNVHNYSTFVQIQDSVFTSLSLGKEIEFGNFAVSSELGIKILDFRGLKSNRYAMGQIGLDLSYSIYLFKNFNLTVEVPLEYALSANGKSVSAGLNVLFGWDCKNEAE